MSETAFSPDALSALGPFDPVPRKSASESNPYLQVVWDSTSLGTFKECPYKHFLAQVCGYTPAARKPALEFGIAYHAALELWDKLLADGADKTEAMFQVIQCAGWQGTKLPSGDTARTLETLVRSVIWYLDQFHNDSAKTVILASGKPAVELSFLFEFAHIDTEDFYLSGHIDRLVEFQGRPWFMDRKTTKSSLDDRYFAQYSPDNQMDFYTAASQIVWEVPCAGGIIDAAQLSPNFTRFKRQEIHRTPEQIDEWLEDTHEWLAQAKRCADNQHWPKNEKSCSAWGGCPFRKVCAHSPSVRPTFLAADFARRGWDPAVAR